MVVLSLVKRWTYQSIPLNFIHRLLLTVIILIPLNVYAIPGTEIVCTGGNRVGDILECKTTRLVNGKKYNITPYYYNVKQPSKKITDSIGWIWKPTDKNTPLIRITASSAGVLYLGDSYNGAIKNINILPPEDPPINIEISGIPEIINSQSVAKINYTAMLIYQSGKRKDITKDVSLTISNGILNGGSGSISIPIFRTDSEIYTAVIISYKYLDYKTFEKKIPVQILAVPNNYKKDIYSSREVIDIIRPGERKYISESIPSQAPYKPVLLKMPSSGKNNVVFYAKHLYGITPIRFLYSPTYYYSYYNPNPVFRTNTSWAGEYKMVYLQSNYYGSYEMSLVDSTNISTKANDVKPAGLLLRDNQYVEFAIPAENIDSNEKVNNLVKAQRLSYVPTCEVNNPYQYDEYPVGVNCAKKIDLVNNVSFTMKDGVSMWNFYDEDHVIFELAEDTPLRLELEDGRAYCQLYDISGDIKNISSALTASANECDAIYSLKKGRYLLAVKPYNSYRNTTGSSNYDSNYRVYIRRSESYQDSTWISYINKKITDRHYRDARYQQLSNIPSSQETVETIAEGQQPQEQPLDNILTPLYQPTITNATLVPVNTTKTLLENRDRVTVTVECTPQKNTQIVRGEIRYKSKDAEADYWESLSLRKQLDEPCKFTREFPLKAYLDGEYEFQFRPTIEVGGENNPFSLDWLNTQLSVAIGNPGPEYIKSSISPYLLDRNIMRVSVEWKHDAIHTLVNTEARYRYRADFYPENGKWLAFDAISEFTKIDDEHFEFLDVDLPKQDGIYDIEYRAIYMEKDGTRKITKWFRDQFDFSSNDYTNQVELMLMADATHEIKIVTTYEELGKAIIQEMQKCPECYKLDDYPDYTRLPAQEIASIFKDKYTYELKQKANKIKAEAYHSAFIPENKDSRKITEVLKRIGYDNATLETLKNSSGNERGTVKNKMKKIEFIDAKNNLAQIEKLNNYGTGVAIVIDVYDSANKISDGQASYFGQSAKIIVTNAGPFGAIFDSAAIVDFGLGTNASGTMESLTEAALDSKAREHMIDCAIEKHKLDGTINCVADRSSCGMGPLEHFIYVTTTAKDGACQ